MAERSVTIKILGDASKAQRAFADAGTSATTFEGKVDGLGSKLGGLAAVAGGTLLAGGIGQLGSVLLDGAKGAAEDAAALDRLKQAVSNTGASYDQYGDAIDDAISRGQQLAFSDGETMEALSLLTSMTGDTEEAMKRLGLAQDLARGAGISLDQAAKLLGKTSDENTAALGRLGIKLGENATAQDVLNAVDAAYGGQAGIYAESAAGQMDIAAQQAGELAETFGGMLIPVISLVTATLLTLVNFLMNDVAPAVQGLLDAFMPVADFVQANLVPILAGLGAALLTLAATAIPGLIAAAMAFVTTTAPALIAQGIAIAVAYAPLTLAILAIAAAVAGLAYAWEHNLGDIQGKTEAFVGWITPYWNATWGAIQQVIDTVMPIVATIVTTYVAVLRKEIEIGVAAARLVFDTVFPVIQRVVETVMPIVAAVVTTYIGILRTEIETGVAAAKWAFDNVFVPIQGVVSDVFTTISGLVTTIWGPAVTAITVGVDTAKAYFDTAFVPIQGVVDDVFNTISDTVSTMWNGATGAVMMVGQGMTTLKGYFSNVYDTFKGYADSLFQGLKDGFSGVVEFIQGIIDGIMEQWNRIPSFLRPGSPSKWATEMGQSLSDGLAFGIVSRLPLVKAAVTEILNAVAPIERIAASFADGSSTGGTINLTNPYAALGVSSQIWNTNRMPNFGLSMGHNQSSAGAGGHYIAPHQWWQGMPSDGGGFGGGALPGGGSAGSAGGSGSAPGYGYGGRAGNYGGSGAGAGAGYGGRGNSAGTGAGAGAGAGIDPRVRLHPDDIEAIARAVGRERGRPI